jgi:hypothetical protein
MGDEGNASQLPRHTRLAKWERHPMASLPVQCSRTGLERLVERAKAALQVFDLYPEQRVKYFYPVPEALPDAITPWRVIFRDTATQLAFGLDIYSSVVLGRSGPEAPTQVVNLDRLGARLRGVSREHVLLHPAASGLLAVDLVSTYGTFLDNCRYRAWEPIHLWSGALLTLGRLELLVEIATHSPPLRPV